jgi:hypothetical protein
VTCGNRRPLAFRRLTAILVPPSEDAIALPRGRKAQNLLVAIGVEHRKSLRGKEAFSHIDSPTKNPDGPKFDAPKGEESFDDIEETEQAQIGADHCEAA